MCETISRPCARAVRIRRATCSGRRLRKRRSKTAKNEKNVTRADAKGAKMKTLILGSILFAVSATGYASNWEFAGGAKTEKGDTYEFFDAESVTKPDRDTVRVWVKSMLRAKLNQTSKSEKQVIDAGARKFSAGYCPRILKLPSVSKQYGDAKALSDACIDAMVLELKANLPESMEVSKILFELDCKGKRSRPLEMLFFDEKQKLKSSTRGKPGEWAYVSPDSNAEHWHALLCK